MAWLHFQHSHVDQCWWDCQNWQENNDFKDAMNTPQNYQWPNLPQKSDCYQDCNTSGNVGELPEGSTVTVAEGEFPWMCSLQDAGLSGGHRCGVTLLSGPASQQTVLVGAAQCNWCAGTGKGCWICAAPYGQTMQLLAEW